MDSLFYRIINKPYCKEKDWECINPVGGPDVDEAERAEELMLEVIRTDKSTCSGFTSQH